MSTAGAEKSALLPPSEKLGVSIGIVRASDGDDGGMRLRIASSTLAGIQGCGLRAISCCYSAMNF